METTKTHNPCGGKPRMGATTDICFVMRFLRGLALVVLALSMPLRAGAQNASRERRDSLLRVGRELRAKGLYGEAIYHFDLVGGERGLCEKALTNYECGRFRDAYRQCKTVVALKGLCEPDARLIMARVKDAQGYFRIASFRYRQFYADKSKLLAGVRPEERRRSLKADAAYYAAQMNTRRGRADQAVALLQTAITADPSLPEAHHLLAEIQINNGHRYYAVAALYGLLLLCPDYNGAPEALKGLCALLNPKARSLNLFGGTLAPEEAYLNEAIDTLCETPAQLAEYTELIARRMLEARDSSLDWWQVTYGDMLAGLCEAGLCKAMAHHIWALARPEEAATWVAEHQKEYAELVAWLSVR